MAESFLNRWRGLRGRPEGTAIMLKTRSVHARGLPDPFVAVALTDDLVVSEVRRVDPGGVAWFKGSAAVLELPLSSEVPRPGDRLEVVDG